MTVFNEHCSSTDMCFFGGLKGVRLILNIALWGYPEEHPLMSKDQDNLLES